MKKSLNLFAAIAIAVFMVACSGDSKEPEKTAEKYLNFLAEGNYDEASKLGTEDTKQMLNFLKSLSGGQKPEKVNEVKDVKCTVGEDGETAECTYCCNEEGGDDKIDMKKIEGNWLVDMKKENPMEGMNFEEDMEGAFEDSIDVPTEEMTETPNN